VYIRVKITLRNGNYHRQIRFDQGLARGFRFGVVGEHVPGELRFFFLGQSWNGTD
jgi:hypothetical protein